MSANYISYNHAPHTKSKSEKETLLRVRTEVLGELARLRELIRSEIDLEIEEGDEQITEHETAAILIAILSQKLDDIDAALAAIDTGEYSRCERCGKTIDAGRLAAKPNARYCITCQSVVEKIIHQNQMMMAKAMA